MIRTSGAIDPMLAARDRYFAPCVLAPFAENMGRRLSRLSNGPLLEIACGTGILTQAMAASLSAGLAIIATDPDATAIEHASFKSGMSRVTWQQATPLPLPYRNAMFGIVTCLFAISTLPDHAETFREVRRVMKLGGRFVFSVPSPIERNPVALCIQAELEALFPREPPGFLTRGLHGYGDSDAIDEDLTEAGFTDAIYTSVELPFAAASAEEVALGYCMGTPLTHEVGPNHQAVTGAVRRALERQFGTGLIRSTMRALVVSAAG